MNMSKERYRRVFREEGDDATVIILEMTEVIFKNNISQTKNYVNSVMLAL